MLDSRTKPAQEHVEKGLSFLRKGFDFCAYPWPGTNSMIKETNHEDLEIALKSMLQECRAHHKPDAVCRHENCLKISTHILPSDSIFYNDVMSCPPTTFYRVRSGLSRLWMVVSFPAERAVPSLVLASLSVTGTRSRH
ncbi:unnamed protein product, partial [Timema podura]|nr:unnamed protein product [Timema podura]